MHFGDQHHLAMSLQQVQKIQQEVTTADYMWMRTSAMCQQEMPRAEEPRSSLFFKSLLGED